MVKVARKYQHKRKDLIKVFFPKQIILFNIVLQHISGDSDGDVDSEIGKE